MLMSNHTNSNIHLPSNTKYSWSAIGLIALIVAVAGVGLFLYFFNAPKPLNLEIVQERKAKLADVNAKQDELINNYAWVDQTKGIVRIPVEKAMPLTVEKLRTPNPSNNSQSNKISNKSKD